MILKRMEITNFKGFDHIKVEFGIVTTIQAKNGVGKSSIFDAWMWLVTGVDSLGRSRFDIRPVDENGNSKNTDDIAVSADILLDNKTTHLVKFQTIKDGKNVNVYQINGYEYKEKDYKAQIESLFECPVDTIKALSSPSLFFGQHWTAQRSMIMALAGDIKDEDIADKELLEFLKEHAVDEVKAKYEKDAKAIKKTLAEIPIRIDENEKMKPEYMDMRINQLKEEQRKLSQDIANCEKVLYLCEKYRVAKCKAVEDSVNGNFEADVNFRLYDDNDKEMCELTYKGVPYSVLSTGQRIMVGLEVVRALHRHIDLYFPIWVDNTESYSGKFICTSQCIMLKVGRNKDIKVVRE